MKVLIADKFPASGVAGLQALPAEVACEPELKDDALARRLGEFDPEILIVRSTKAPSGVMSSGKNLKLIIRAGSGFDTIDTAAARQRGVDVCNCPGMNSVAVAELVMGLMIAADRRIPDNVADLRAGKWNKKEYGKSRGLKGRTLGIVGAGRIGREVARRAAAFDMSILYYDVVSELTLDFLNCERAELDDLLARSDFVTLHTPGGDPTKHLIDERRLGLMKPDAVLINAARAGVVDDAALARALKEGRLRAAGLDVYENEPPAEGKTFDLPIAAAPNLYGTHHIGASTEQAQLAVAEETVRIVAEFAKTGRALNCVNA